MSCCGNESTGWRPSEHQCQGHSRDPSCHPVGPASWAFWGDYGLPYLCLNLTFPVLAAWQISYHPKRLDMHTSWIWVWLHSQSMSVMLEIKSCNILLAPESKLQTHAIFQAAPCLPVATRSQSLHSCDMAYLSHTYIYIHVYIYTHIYTNICIDLCL